MSSSYHSQSLAGPSSSSLAANPSASAPAAAAPRRSRRHRPRCPQCGSKHFKRHASTGTLVCREGHVLQGYREEETHDDLDFHAVGYKRQVKKKRRKKERERVEVWHGPRTRFLVFECLQLILRLQLKALRVEWPHLPPEIEAIARDLWAMYVSTYDDLAATPYDENLTFVKEQIKTAREEQEEMTRGGRRRNNSSRSRSRALEEEQERERREQSQREQREEDEEMRELERRLEADMRGENVVDDNEDEEGEGIAAAASRKTSTSSTPQWRRFRPLIHLVSILYLTLVTARIPVLWSDVLDLLLSSRVPYLGAFLLLPPAMTDKLPAPQLAKLEETTVPSILTLQECAGSLAGDLNQRYGIKFPELNAAPLVWRCVRHMGLSPSFYQPTLSLLTYLGVPMAVVPSQAVGDSWSHLDGDDEAEQTGDGGKKASISRLLPPLTARLNLTTRAPVASRCSVIMAAVVVVAKMVYGLDGLPRSLDDGNGTTPSCSPSLHHWLTSLSHLHSSILPRTSGFAHELNVSPAVLDEDGIDEIVAFAEQTFLQRTQPNVRHTRRKGDGLLEDLFPRERCRDATLPQFLPPFGFMEAAAEAQGQGGEGSGSKKEKKSMLQLREELADRLNEEIYGSTREGDDDGEDDDDDDTHDNPANRARTTTSSPSSTALHPGQSFSIQSSTDAHGVLHPSFQRVLDYAASLVGLGPTCSAVVGEGQGVAGEARGDEMSVIVGDLERVLLRRLRASKRGKASG